MPIMDGATVEEVFRTVDLVGVFGNAAIGAAVARAERLDPVGFATLAILSGLGGGMIRDTLLQQGPPAAFTDNAYILTALAAAALTYLVTLEGPVWERVLPVVDAVALGAWAAAGALKTLSAGLGWLPALLLGVITACGGGALRDIVVRRTPTVLGGNTLYATCALVAAGVMISAHSAGQSNVGLLAATLTGATLCLLARRRGWMLPDRDSWSPRQMVPVGIVPRRARKALRARRDALLRRSSRPNAPD